MARCTRKGCGKDFSDDSQEKCIYHSGSPVFHEGLKSWSCCSDVHKPVLDFNEFMHIPGCAEADAHTIKAEKPDKTTQVTATTSTTLQQTIDEKEAFSTIPNVSSSPSVSVVRSQSALAPTPTIEEEDDLSVSVKPGTLCRRKGCGVSFVSDDINRSGEGEGTVCIYHSAPPIFREGSKGYLCCKRRVLEFDEFLKIKGCKTGRHVFAPKIKTSATTEVINCRIDHYQTPHQVHVSVFAKQVDKAHSKINFTEKEVSLDLYLPGDRQFTRTLNLFGPIDPQQSTFQIFGTKVVELQLQKQDTRSWTVLEKTDKDLGNISLTFGVTGRTGTVGGKEVVLDESNKARA
ncbi:HSP20-like chaperone [Cyathus striatus]|nr:HSP20-like chaperone [Cyathus striatus]